MAIPSLSVRPAARPLAPERTNVPAPETAAPALPAVAQVASRSAAPDNVVGAARAKAAASGMAQQLQARVQAESLGVAGAPARQQELASDAGGAVAATASSDGAAPASIGEVRPGSKGPDVLTLKTAMKDAGFYNGVLNDEMGPDGVRSLKAAKQALQLGGPEDVAGPTTLEALRNAAKAPASLNVPLVDQYAMNSPNRGGYCGVASTMMAIAGKTGKLPVDIHDAAALKEFGDQMYLPGQGSSGALMAQTMREQGLPARYTTTGSQADIVKSLQAGQAVPLGIASISGTVREDVQSERYGALSAGDAHSHTYGPAGHWIAVTGFEGPAENPSAFLVNDPDTGAKLRMTPAEIQRAAEGDGNMWLISKD